MLSALRSTRRHILPRLCQKQLATCRRAEAIELARVLGTDRSWADWHPADGVAPADTGVGDMDHDRCPLPRLAPDRQSSAGQLGPLAHAAQPPVAIGRFGVRW